MRHFFLRETVIDSKTPRRAILAAALALLPAVALPGSPDIVTVGAGSYRTSLVAGPGWEGPATTFGGGTPASPLITSNLAGVPLPTNDWWTSLMWPTGSPVPDPYSSPLIAYPLIGRAQADGLGIGRQNTANAVNGRIGSPTDLTVGLVGLSVPETRAHDFSDWTVTADWGDGALRATLGRGLPFVYFERGSTADVVVELTGPAPLILSNTGSVALVRSRGSYYGLFAPAGATWSGLGTTLTSTLSGADYFSVAHIPAADNGQALAMLPDFTARAHAHVTDTTVSWSYDESTALMTSTFTVTLEQKETGPGLLNETYMALLPHQWRHSTTPTTGMQYDSVKGIMEVVSGTSFETQYRFTGVLPMLPPVANAGSGYDPATLRDYLGELQNFTPPLIDTYFGGKDIAKLMQAAWIAKQAGETALFDRHVALAKGVLEDWFHTDLAEEQDLIGGAGRRVLYYDEQWGTLIGFPASFGSNTFLNDHHFHYGYWIMTGALIAGFDPDWAAPSEWGGMMELLIRDVASGDRNDPLFPFLRSFDVYAGHAWAGGPGDGGSGNNQESSSESMNCWAGMILWGEETGNIAVRDRGIFLYSTESAAIDEYWYDVYEENFPRIDYNQEITGIHFGDGNAYATFFNGEEEAIMGIQCIPVTAAMLYWGRHPDEVIEIFDAMNAQNEAKGGPGAPFDLFQDLLWSFLATADADRAIALFNAANTPNPYNVEGGESRAHTYHWLHNLASLGLLDESIHGDNPFSMVFDKQGVKTYCAYNPDSTERLVTFSDGTAFRVPPGEVVGVRRPIAVSLTAPAAGTVFDVGASVALEALVDPIGGFLIAQVEFFVDGISVGIDTTEPYEGTFVPVVEAFFDATAVATDTGGGTATAPAVRFRARVPQQAFGGTPTVIVADATTRIEAEEYDQGGPGEAYFDLTPENEGNAFRPTEGVDVEATTDTGGGFNVGFMGDGEWMEYTVDVEVAGHYELDLRVAALNAGPRYRMEIAGADVSGEIAVPQTGGFQNWVTVRAGQQVPLPQGVVILRIATITGLGNINWFELTGPENSGMDWWMIR